MRLVWLSKVKKEKSGSKITHRHSPHGLHQASKSGRLLEPFRKHGEWTVGSSKKGIALSKLVGLEPPYLEPGPLPDFDHCGYGMAIQLLLKPREAGRYHTSHQQWDTVRRMSMAYRNQVRASGAANSSTLSVGEADGKKYSRICGDPCSSLWYSRFSAGCKGRMGQDWRPDRAMTPKLMKVLFSKIEDRLLWPET
jgi:hypothetical protein